MREDAQPAITTRRRFLGAAAGIAAGGLAIAASASRPGMAAAATRRLTAAPGPVPTIPPLAGHVGATVTGIALGSGCYDQGLTQDQAEARWEGFVHRRIAVTKLYNKPSVFPTSLRDNNVDRYIARGVKCCISFRPEFRVYTLPVQAELDREALRNTLALYSSSGLQAEICFWQEPANPTNDLTPLDYAAMYRYYGKTVQDYYPLVANLNYANDQPSNYTDYANAVVGLVNGFAIDYYYHTYGASATNPGLKLAPAAKIADDAGVPFGIWEFNTAGPKPWAPTEAKGDEYLKYLLEFMRARSAAGRVNGQIMWFDGLCSAFEPDGQPYAIVSGSDYRISLYQQMWDDLSPNAIQP